MRPVEGENTASLSITKVLALKATLHVCMPTYASTVLVNVPDSSAHSVGKDNTAQQQQNRPTMTCTRNNLLSQKRLITLLLLQLMPTN